MKRMLFSVALALLAAPALAEVRTFDWLELIPQEELKLLQDQPVFRNAHDVCVDDAGDLYGCQWNADQAYPYKLHRV